MQISKIINKIKSIKINSFVLKKIIIPKNIHKELKKFFFNNKQINILDVNLNFLKKKIPLFSKFIIEKKIYLENPGYFILGIDNHNIYNLNEKKKIYLIIGKLLGGFLSQNSKGDYLVEVQDKGKTLKKGARYHESNEAGNLHTDSPQWNKTPSVVGLYCYKPAIKGGDSVLVNSFALLKKASKNKTILKNIFEKYHFDKRGDLKTSDKNETTYASIFSYDKNMFRFRYLRDYIISGSKKMDYKLTYEKIKVLDFVDDFLNNSKNQIKKKLIAGDAIFFNNHIYAHGRTKFKDHLIKSKKRLYFRLWVK